MKTISATNLRVQLRDLLAGLDTGPVTITKHGKVVAVLTAPVVAVEAVEVTPTTEDTSEAPDASQSEPEPELRYPHSIPAGANAPSDLAYEDATPDQRDWYGMEEEDDLLGGLDAEFEAYLSSQARMDRPMP